MGKTKTPTHTHTHTQPTHTHTHTHSMAISEAGFFPFEEAKEISKLNGIVGSIVCLIYD
jgi:hypothetical protein